MYPNGIYLSPKYLIIHVGTTLRPKYIVWLHGPFNFVESRRKGRGSHGADHVARGAREPRPVEWTRFGVLGLGCRVFGSGFEVQGVGLESRVFGLRV